MALAAYTRSTGSSYSVPLIATGRPWANRMVTSSASMATAGSQNRTPIIGWTVSNDTSRCSRVLASCVAPQMFASVEYAFSWLSRYGRSRSASQALISCPPPSSSTNSASSHGL